MALKKRTQLTIAMLLLAPICVGLYAVPKFIGNESLGSVTYMGRASVKIVLADQRVIYIDPYAGTSKDYADPADFVLVTHQHSDHNQIDLVTLKETGKMILAPLDARPGDVIKEKDLEFIAVDAFNSNHPKGSGVGYIIKAKGITLYHSGDTSYYKEMANLAQYSIDYAFLCMDGYYNMGPDEATRVAETIKPKHVIPMHTAKSGDYDQGNADSFKSNLKVSVLPGGTLQLK